MSNHNHSADENAFILGIFKQMANNPFINSLDMQLGVDEFKKLYIAQDSVTTVLFWFCLSQVSDKYQNHKVSYCFDDDVFYFEKVAQSAEPLEQPRFS